MALTQVRPEGLGFVNGNRNLIINGAMQVWQRGTSQTVSGSYGPDRFWMANATSATRDTDAPSGFVYSTKLTYNASDIAIGQPVELPATGGQGQLVSGQTVTLSYYAKVDAGAEAISTIINFRDSKFSSANQAAFTPTVTGGENAGWNTTWTRYTHSFTVPTVASTNVLAGLEIYGIGRTAYITGIQLELGEQATPFEHRSFGDELAACQRYFQRLGEYTTNSYPVNGQCYIYGATNVAGSFQLISSMRASSPTVSFPNGNFGVRAGSAANNQYEFSSINNNQGATQGVMQFDATVASGIQVNTIGVVVNAGNNRYMFVDAEL